MGYAITALFKLCSLIHAPRSGLSSVFGESDLKLDWFLDELVVVLGKASERGRCEPAGEFWRIVGLMRAWWGKNKERIVGEGTATTLPVMPALPNLPALPTTVNILPPVSEPTAYPSYPASDTPQSQTQLLPTNSKPDNGDQDQPHDYDFDFNPEEMDIDPQDLFVLSNMNFVSYFDQGMDWGQFSGGIGGGWAMGGTGTGEIGMGMEAGSDGDFMF